MTKAKKKVEAKDEERVSSAEWLVGRPEEPGLYYAWDGWRVVEVRVIVNPDRRLSYRVNGADRDASDFSAWIGPVPVPEAPKAE